MNKQGNNMFTGTLAELCHPVALAVVWDPGEWAGQAICICIQNALPTAKLRSNNLHGKDSGLC